MQRLEAVDALLKEQLRPRPADDELDEIRRKSRYGDRAEQKEAVQGELPVPLPEPCKQHDSADKIPFGFSRLGDGIPEIVPGAMLELMKPER